MMGNLFIIGRVQMSELKQATTHELRWMQEWIDIAYPQRRPEGDPDKFITSK